MSTPFACSPLSLLSPPRCLACRRLAPGPLELRLCSRCRARLAVPPPAGAPIAGLDEWLAVADYRGPAMGLIAALKSGAAPAAAETIAELIAEALGPLEPATVVTPVGASRRRLLRRGLDPATEIAIALACRLGLVAEPILSRTDRRRQRGRPRELRLAEPPTFRARPPVPARVLVVDDVLTTGGTLASCARTLRAAGARQVAAVAFARTPAPGVT